MPKYIRTKDRIYGVIEENSNYYKCCYDNGRITLVAKFDNDVNGFSKALNQADTIEELIDEFVIEYRDESKIISIYDNTDEFLIEHKDEIESGYIKNIYGAIWTDKGLIYVAKMNEDGELVLIWQ